MNILVTGGAGYIGSIAVKKLCDQGHNVTVLDNLTKGRRELSDKRALLIEGDIVDSDHVNKAFEISSPNLVLHFAAYKDAGESMQNPTQYSHNIKGLINLLDCMVSHKTAKIIFSSTAAVYGNPQYLPIDEDHPTMPINYYGFTKLTSEQLIQWYSRTHQFKYVILRYFNVIGDGGLDYIDPKPSNIAPILMEVITGKRSEIQINGNDYNTPDGTCVRDYIDVQDLVRAHILAIDYDKNDIFNLGTQKGASVLDLVKLTELASGKEIKKLFRERRAGDPPILTASSQKAENLLNWRPLIELPISLNNMLKAYKIPVTKKESNM